MFKIFTCKLAYLKEFMELKSKLGALFCLVSCVGIWAFESPQLQNLNYKNLCDHIEKYETTNVDWHAGDLLEHTIWVTTIIENWFCKRNTWIEGLDQEDCKLAMACGFMHDIGKAGDLEFVFKNKPSHPQDGFEYILNKKPFYTDQTEIYNLNEWFRANGFSADEQKVIAIIAGIHWDFGLVLKRINDGEPEKLVFDDFINKLEQLTQDAAYNDGIVTKQLLLFSILINAADVKGLHFASPCCGNECHLPVLSQKRSVTNIAYLVHGHKKFGKKVRKQLIEYFDNYYGKE